METYYQTIYDYFLRLHEDARQVVMGVPQEKLDWSPGEGVNSMAVLVVHMAAAERFWIGDVALGEPSNRDRASEFEVGGLSLDELLARAGALRALFSEGTGSASIRRSKCRADITAQRKRSDGGVLPGARPGPYGTACRTFAADGRSGSG
jgi:hypothetical protein